ncbi:hypothetical protein KMW28_10190 [Flammeovirga yaeyamensis]|uniref:Uncharacterized protein n=1 Tax=Flammeovirga yaeyamensis TaxID=367791 RepID=A0AAX1MXE8_9BACT|nr:hypothetical protein [Flammeovirga yaeyamensis]MBB3696478.1 hypothetical protein [Flammeovirga yaeyamensis]NMF35156.1 hypothetical protein [Flammeovirga yaeyamensis]QWG00024.1 hypothetical protein KMW28_10190 [Flammeovirga yaeyamensis]
MEKSIETMWKEGFLNKDALVAPKVNNLYNKKSLHISAKFKRMFLNNILGIIICSSLLFIGSYFAGALIAGSIVLIMMLYVAYTAYNELKSLEKIDKGQSSYLFLKSYKNWIDQSIERYGKMYRFLYPLLILTVYLGIWFSGSFENIRERVSENSDLFFGLHLGTTLLVLSIAILMSVFSKAIHRKDVQIIYGGILNKLESSLEEMEQLRN